MALLSSVMLLCFCSVQHTQHALPEGALPDSATAAGGSVGRWTEHDQIRRRVNRTANHQDGYDSEHLPHNGRRILLRCKSRQVSVDGRNFRKTICTDLDISPSRRWSAGSLNLQTKQA